MVAPAERTIPARPHRPRFVRLLNRAGPHLERLGIARVDLSEEGILAEARRKAGLSEWRDERFRVPLQLLLHDLEHESKLNYLGRRLARRTLADRLANRLRLDDVRRRQPEVFGEPITRPIVIAGFARTGTTLLHNLLAQDAAARAPLFWEVSRPAPPPEPETRETDPRIKEVAKDVESIAYLAPQIRVVHPLDARAVEEDLPLFANTLVSQYFPTLFDVPGYWEWLLARGDGELISLYEQHRAQLQCLQWRVRGDHWVVKGPSHQYFLRALLTVYPDARVIQTHRDPLLTIPSLCSFFSVFRGIFSDHVDLGAIGRFCLDAFVVANARAIEARASLDPTRFLDLRFEELVRDPVATVRQAYRYFGLPFEPAFAERMREWIAKDSQRLRVPHRYTLEQFGLDAATVDRRTEPYREWMQALTSFASPA